MERFTDQVLEATAMATGRAHALRKLADRFPPSVESRLADRDLTVLNRLRADHMDALIRSAGEIQRIIGPVFHSLGVQPNEAALRPNRAASWQAATPLLLETASRVDRLLTMVVTGAGGNQDSLLPDTADAVKQFADEAARHR